MRTWTGSAISASAIRAAIIFDAYFTGPQLRELRKVHAFEKLRHVEAANLT